jgi:TM2 domain-containing membrane protein YozV
MRENFYSFLKICLYIFLLFIWIIGFGFLKEESFSQEIESVKFLKKESVSNNDDTLNVKSPLGAAVRSLFVPGLGQIYNEKKVKAFLAFTGEGVLIYSIFNENKKYNDTNDTKYRDKRNTLQWWLFFVIGLSVVDAYVDAYLDRFNEDMNISFNGKSFNLFIKF